MASECLVLVVLGEEMGEGTDAAGGPGCQEMQGCLTLVSFGRRGARRRH